MFEPSRIKEPEDSYKRYSRHCIIIKTLHFEGLYQNGWTPQAFERYKELDLWLDGELLALAVALDKK